MTIVPLVFFALHNMQRVLDDEVGCAHVDIHHGIKELGLGIPDGAAIGNSGRIDHRIDAAKSLVCGGYHLARIVHASEIGLDKNGFDAFLFEIGLDARAILFIAPGNHDALAAPIGEEMGDGFAEALGGAGDDGDLAIHRKFGERFDIHYYTFTGLPVFHDSVAASASFCACKPS